MADVDQLYPTSPLAMAEWIEIVDGWKCDIIDPSLR